MTVILQEREITYNIRSAMGNTSSDKKEFLHVNAESIPGTLLFCPVEWNIFHLCVGSLAPLDGKMATCQGCRWKGLLSTALLGGRATWETLFFISSSLGSCTAVLGPFCSSVIQDSHEGEKLCDAPWYMGEMLVVSKCEAGVSCGFCFNETGFPGLKQWIKRVSFPQSLSSWRIFKDLYYFQRKLEKVRGIVTVFH